MYISASLPSVVVGIVCIAHSIEIELLEQFDVSQHGFLSDSFASPVLMHVAVHSLDHDGLVVVQQLLPLYLILAEANLHKQEPFSKASQVDIGFRCSATCVLKVLMYELNHASGDLSAVAQKLCASCQA